MYPIDEGQWVLLTISKGIVPSRCLYGQAWVVTDLGVRIRLHAFNDQSAQELPIDCDYFVPWRHIESALISRPEQSEYSSFSHAAGHHLDAMRFIGWHLHPDYSSDN